MEPRVLRVMTFNIHGGRPRVGMADLDATARVIQEAAPDFAGLQEVHRYLPPPYVFQDQPSKLRDKLGMHVKFVRAFGLGPVGYGNAVLARTAPRCVRRRRLPSGFEPRILVEAEYEVEGRRLLFMNTHLGLGEEERLRQCRVIAQRLQEVRLPTIIVGDWNAEPDSEGITEILGTGMRDGAAKDVHTFPCDNPNCRLDYVFFSPHFELRDCYTIQTDVSDHLPLVAELVFR